MRPIQTITPHTPLMSVLRRVLVGCYGMRVVSCMRFPTRDLRELLPVVGDDEEGKEIPLTGRAWMASELRLKTFDDLHKLWFVLLKEKNRLHTQKLQCNAERRKAPDLGRKLAMVRLSMARLKTVVGERLRAFDTTWDEGSAPRPHRTPTHEHT